MPRHLARYTGKALNPGVVLLREATPIAAAPIATIVDEPVLILSPSEGHEWMNRLFWIPL
jgi:hypothetical protein